MAQYKDFKKSQRVETIINIADGYIFLLRHSPFPVLYILRLNEHLRILIVGLVVDQIE